MTNPSSPISYHWNIDQMEYNVADGIVFVVRYTVLAKDGAYSAASCGSVSLEHPDDHFIPYTELTQETVIGWVKDKLGGAGKVTAIEVSLQAQINEQRAPTKSTGLPWDA